MLKLKLFNAYHLYELETDVNNWLDKQQAKIRIENQQYATSTVSSSGDYGNQYITEYSVAIWYTEF